MEQTIEQQIELARQDTIPICSICLEEVTKDKFITKCNHVFHIQCFAKFIEKNFEKKLIPCPNCMIEFVNIFNPRILYNEFHPQAAMPSLYHNIETPINLPPTEHVTIQIPSRYTSIQNNSRQNNSRYNSNSSNHQNRTIRNIQAREEYRRENTDMCRADNRDKSYCCGISTLVVVTVISLLIYVFTNLSND